MAVRLGTIFQQTLRRTEVWSGIVLNARAVASGTVSKTRTELKNHIKLGGTVENDYDGAHIILKGEDVVPVKVIPEVSIKTNFENLTKGMKVIVHGRLSQQVNVVEKSGRFRYESCICVFASGIDIVTCWEVENEVKDGEP